MSHINNKFNYLYGGKKKIQGSAYEVDYGNGQKVVVPDEIYHIASQPGYELSTFPAKYVSNYNLNPKEYKDYVPKDQQKTIIDLQNKNKQLLNKIQHNTLDQYTKNLLQRNLQMQKSIADYWKKQAYRERDKNLYNYYPTKKKIDTLYSNILFNKGMNYGRDKLSPEEEAAYRILRRQESELIKLKNKNKNKKTKTKRKKSRKKSKKKSKKKSRKKSKKKLKKKSKKNKSKKKKKK